MAEAELFGTRQDGTAVHRVRLQRGGLRVQILTLGAALQSVRLEGVGHDLTLGSEAVADYEGEMRHHGTLIAPVVNRLTGGEAPLPGGQRITVPLHSCGRYALHSGPGGTHLKTWRITRLAAELCEMALDLPDGEAGFPGNRQVRAVYRLIGQDCLELAVSALSDAPSLWNAANHSYWNLDGTADFSGHRLQIPADRYLPTDGFDLVTGEIAAVAGGPMDFRRARSLAPGQPPLDNCFCLAEGPGRLRPALELTGRSGLRMRVSTTEAGVQVYDARGARRPGGGLFEGLAVECQAWPDAPNHAGFGDISLVPGQQRTQVTQWKFDRTEP